jgi:uncharacterized protein (TIGR00255 family)
VKRSSSPAKAAVIRAKAAAIRSKGAVIRSMTGFGGASIAKGGSTARVEVRSVNHRHLQIKVRTPSDLGHLESVFDGLVRETLERGSVSVSAELEHEASANAVQVNASIAKRYQKLLNGLGKQLGIEGGVSLDTLIGLPGVIGAGEADADREKDDDLLVACTRKALDELLAMRATEGASLLADLRKNTQGISGLVAGIEKRMPMVVREHHENLQKRVELLLDGQAGRVTIRPEDLAREMALLADKMDVGEEVARLSSHHEQWEALLGKGGSVGRQLEFLVQELLREANTIGSKCNDAQVAHAVVEMKTLIERLREQVQNVE